MAQEQPDWLQRRSQRARCKKHGLHYDPALTSGCALCRKENPQVQREGAKLIPFLLSLFGLAVVAFQLSSAEFGYEPAALERKMPEHGSAANLLPGLDPESFREWIVRIDEALFVAPAQSLESAAAGGSAAMMELSTELAQADGAAQQNLSAQLEALARSAPVDPDYRSLEELRTKWLVLRRRSFEPASWFKLPARLEEDRVALLAWRGASDDLLELLSETQSRALSLTSETNASVDETDASEWTSWTSKLSLEIGRIQSSLPPRPSTSASDRILLAVQNLERALGDAHGLAGARSPEELPPMDPLTASAEEARQGFSDSLRS